MSRVACIAVLFLLSPPFAQAQWGAPPGSGGFVEFHSGRGGVSVGIGHPFGYFSYSGSFPYPRAYDPFLYGRSFDGYVAPYGTYYDPQSGYVDHYLPPIHYPGELMYGPLAVRRFFGLDRVPYPTATPPGIERAGVLPGAPAPRPRASNPAARERASHFVAAGDQLFREQKHHEALQRYKSASQWAPDLAHTWFRQGFALVATNRFELAADAFRRGLEIDPNWPASKFRLEELYGDTDLARQAHEDALANAALRDPENSDLLFVLGVFLHFDGQQDRATKFFVRARELDADVAPVESFLGAAPAK